MFTKIDTDGVLGLFGDNTGDVIRWEENCVKANNINKSKIILINLFNINFDLSFKHDWLPAMQGF